MGRVPDVHTEQPRFYPPLLDQLRRENAVQPEVAKVWSRFQELAAIPRPTKGEKQTANWVKQWAMERNYDVSQDEFGNVFVQVPESKGFTPTESIPNLIFQGHLDMVDIPTATKDDQHISPGTYGVEPKVETRTDGTLVVVGTNKGKRTSLGADNGIGVAGMMTMAEYFDEHSDTPHAGFGLLFTLHEEDGLLGAHNLAITDVFKPNTLVINVDNEKKENVCLGSAGGGYTDAKVHVNREVIPFDAQVLEISITGHHGGHSGADISTVDTNANQTVGRLLKRALESEPKIDLQLVAIDGGEKKNAIPHEAKVVVTVKNSAQQSQLNALLADEQKERRRTNTNEPEFSITLKPVEASNRPVTMITRASTEKVVTLLTTLPHGIKSYETVGNVAGNVRTSTNFATIKLTDNFADEWVNFGFMTRSSNMEELEARRTEIAQTFVNIDSNRLFVERHHPAPMITQGETFPCWEPGNDQTALSLLQFASNTAFGKTLSEETTHGGLEIGEFLRLFGERFPGKPRQVQFISFGPTINNPHTEHEEVEVESVEWFYTLLCSIPQQIVDWYTKQQETSVRR